MSREPSRFLRAFALAVPPLAFSMGLWTSFQAFLDPSAAHRGHLVWASLVRATAPAASGSALLLAFVLWAHPLRPGPLQRELPRILGRAAVVALPGYLLAALLTVLAGVISSNAERAGLSLVDFALGAGFAAVDGAVLLGLAWRFLPRLQLTSLSLPAKLSLALAVTVPLRATVALVAANTLSP